MVIHNSVYKRLLSMVLFGAFLLVLAVVFAGFLFAENIILATIVFDVVAAVCALAVCRRQGVPVVSASACIDECALLAVIVPVALLFYTWFTAQVTSTLLISSGVSVGGYADLPTDTWPYFVLTLLAAPVCEECLCRRYLFDNLRTLSSAPVWFALVLQALVFGVMHGTAVHVYSGLVVGVFFGLVYLETGRLWMSMAFHSLYNLSCLTLDLELPDVFVSWPFVIILNVGLAGGLTAFYKFVTKPGFISFSGPL